MLMPTELFIFMRCPECGSQMLYRGCSLFALQKIGCWELKCSCGASPCFVETRGLKHFIVNITGSCCDEPHEFFYSLQDMQSGAVYSLSCDVTGTHLGFVGSRQAVLDVLKKEELLLEDDEDELLKYFASPTTMSQVLYHINRLYANEKIICSNCGSRDMDLMPRRQSVVIKCGNCHQGGKWPALVEADVNFLARAEALILKKENLQVLFAGESMPQTKDNIITPV